MEVTTPPVLPVAPSGDRPFRRRTWIVVGVLLLVLFLAFVVRQGASTLYYVLMAWFVALAMEPAVAALGDQHQVQARVGNDARSVRVLSNRADPYAGDERRQALRGRRLAV